MKYCSPALCPTSRPAKTCSFVFTSSKPHPTWKSRSLPSSVASSNANQFYSCNVKRWQSFKPTSSCHPVPCFSIYVCRLVHRPLRFNEMRPSRCPAWTVVHGCHFLCLPTFLFSFSSFSPQVFFAAHFMAKFTVQDIKFLTL